jgi:glutamyl-tRNA synthetase
MLYRGRFAPSPTGDLHLGSAAAAIFCAAAARRAKGRLVVRMEDIDLGRVIPGKDAAMLDDLRWLGVAWDEGPDIGGEAAPYVQSQRREVYQAALERLAGWGLTYYCDCSRAEVARVASAPHAGDAGPRYPGTCRPHGMRARAFRRPPAVRLAVPAGVIVAVDDAVRGPLHEDVSAVTGDFVLRRGDGVFAYQLAVVADDLAMGVTEVVRGDDLASSAPRQALLARLLGGEPPRFAHLPLLVGADGARLAKRAPGMTLRDQRSAGRAGADVVRALAQAYAHDVGEAPFPLAALADRLDFRRLRGLSPRVDARLAGRAIGARETC